MNPPKKFYKINNDANLTHSNKWRLRNHKIY